MGKITIRNLKLYERAALWGLVLALSGALIVLPLPVAAALVVGSIFGTLALVHPEYALYLLVFAVPFGSVKTIRIAGANVGAMEGLFALLIAAWFARVIARREMRIVGADGRPPLPLILPLLIFLGAITLSLLNTLSLQYSLKEIVKWLEFTGVYLFVVNNIDRSRATVLLALIFLAGIAESLLGFYQFFGRVGPEWFVLWERFMRAYGTFEQPNPYAGYLGLILPLAYGVFLHPKGGYKHPKGGYKHPKGGYKHPKGGYKHPKGGYKHPKGGYKQRCSDPTRNTRRENIMWGMAGVALALIGTAMLMSWSRGAWIGFIAAFAAMNVAQSRRALLIFSVVLLIVAATLLLGSLDLLPTALVQRFTDFLPYIGMVDVRGVKVTHANYAVIERLAHWYAAQQMFAASPWLGVGIGNYEPVYAAYALPGWAEPLGHAHNYYLNVAAEAGIVGLAAYLLLWGAIFWQAWRAIRRSDGYWRGVAVGIFGVLVHLATHNFFDNLYVHGMYLHVAMLVGICIKVRRTGARPRRGKVRRT